MTQAILIPLYRPQGRHLLLIKSVISACADVTPIKIFICADGPASEVDWPLTFIDRMLDESQRWNIEISVISFPEAAGYPRVYQRMIALAIDDCKPTILHFIDQDDYCLPNRFLHRSASMLDVTGAILVDELFKQRGAIAPARLPTLPLLETPAPGMTFSVPRDIAERYLGLCSSGGNADSLLHDFVVAELAASMGRFHPVQAASMLYVQHTSNVVGHTTGLRWLKARLSNLPRILKTTRKHAAALDQIYGGRIWLAKRLHRQRLISITYRLALRWFP